MKAYTLYRGKFTRTWITQMVIAEGGVPCSFVDIDILRGQHRTEEYLAVSPTGYVPVMITPDGETLFETPAINLYLVDEYPIPHLNSRNRVKFLSTLFYLSGEIEPAFKRYFYPHRYTREAETNDWMRQHAMDDVLQRLDVVEKMFPVDNSAFIMDDGFSLLDIILAYWSTQISENVLGRRFPRLRNNRESVCERPKIKPLFKEMWEENKNYRAKNANGEGAR